MDLICLPHTTDVKPLLCYQSVNMLASFYLKGKITQKRKLFHDLFTLNSLDGWMDGRMDGRTDRDRQTEIQIDRQTDIHRQTDRDTDGRTDR